MESIHCVNCGGYVGTPRTVMYRARSAQPAAAAPRDRACGCAQPTLLMPVFRASGSQPRATGEREPATAARPGR